MKIKYGDEDRWVKGVLRLPYVAEPGTLLGPNDTGELMVVLGHDGEDTLVGYATSADMSEVYQRYAAGEGPRSLTEMDIHTKIRERL